MALNFNIQVTGSLSDQDRRAALKAVEKENKRIELENIRREKTDPPEELLDLLPVDTPQNIIKSYEDSIYAELMRDHNRWLEQASEEVFQQEGKNLWKKASNEQRELAIEALRGNNNNNNNNNK